MANQQIGALVRELFGNFPLRVKIRRGKSAIMVASAPKEMKVEEEEDRLSIQGSDWTLLLGGLDRVRFTKADAAKKFKRGVDFLDAGGKSVLQVSLRRVDARQAASIDRLEKKYGAIITSTEPQQRGESA